MDKNFKNFLEKAANSIRGLSIDAIEKAKSGHPGLPLGCADLGAYLYANILKHNPKNPNWINRDRLLLSAGHGSMLLYSALHLSGFDVSLDQIKNFRQLDSITPGHPEVKLTSGVEITSGPLGKGVGNAIGMALGIKILQAKFNTKKHKIFENKIYCLASDGCMMEGISHEVCSLAGHWKLDNLILIYDSNEITLDGKMDEHSSNNTKQRFLSYGWNVLEMDGHDFEDIDEKFSKARNNQQKPVLIIAHTKIGKGSPLKEGSSKAHGSPLGIDEVLATKKALNLSEKDFFVENDVYDFFGKKLLEQNQLEEDWNKVFEDWKNENLKRFEEFEKMENFKIPENFEKCLKDIDIKSPMATRSSSGVIINHIAKQFPSFYSGSADLSTSDMSAIKDEKAINANDFTGRNIKYGVREFAMGTISNGLSLLGMFIPLCGTFLVFSDYLRPSIRKAALCKSRVIFQFTHDSIFIGEDGSTHQPVEQIASMRAIPNLQVIRPSDSNEVKMAWIAALKYEGPTALILSRQKLKKLEETNMSFKEGVAKGAYIVKKENGIKADFTIFATGSELSLALDVAQKLLEMKKDVRVVSVPCFELFDSQDEKYRNSILKNSGKKISIEAGSSFGWHKYIGSDGVAVSVEEFGISAPENDIKEKFGFTVDSIVKKIL
jgi:transketolase